MSAKVRRMLRQRTDSNEITWRRWSSGITSLT